MFGVSAETRLGPDAYQPDVSANVYREIAKSAQLILSEAGTVVVDAVFDKPETRTQIEHAASQSSMPFVGVWLDMDAATLLQRVRDRTGGPSDATTEVLQKQLKRDAGKIGWTRLDAGAPAVDIVHAILTLCIDSAGEVAPNHARELLTRIKATRPMP